MILCTLWRIHVMWCRSSRGRRKSVNIGAHYTCKSEQSPSHSGFMPRWSSLAPWRGRPATVRTTGSPGTHRPYVCDLNVYTRINRAPGDICVHQCWVCSPGPLLCKHTSHVLQPTNDEMKVVTPDVKSTAFFLLTRTHTHTHIRTIYRIFFSHR